MGATGIEEDEEEEEKEVIPEYIRACILFSVAIIILRLANSILKHDVDINNI
jgi:hypothetical protein